MKPMVYEGPEPYVFVSYAHRDAERVFEVLNELQSHGYRFWYDDGIAPGSEWPEDIARHLDAATMVIAFITPNAMKSQNCRREINFSLAREKGFLSIVLEKTDMPLGMQMQLSAQQSILRYNYDSWESFIKKIMACPGIEPCRERPAAEAKTVPARDVQAEAVEMPAEPAPEPEPEYHVVEVVPPAEESIASARVELPEEDAAEKQGNLQAANIAELPSSTAEEASSKRAKRVRNKLPRADKQGEESKKGFSKPVAALAVIALIAVAFLVYDIASHFTTSWGERISKGAKTVSAYEGTKIEQSDLTHIAAMGNLHVLDLRGCDLSACDFSAVSFASSDLNKIWLSGAEGIDDFSFLADLELTELEVEGCEAFDDATLAALNVGELKILDMSDTKVTSVERLGEAKKLIRLDIEDTQVTSLEGLDGAERLSELYGANTAVTSLDVLASLANLRVLDFDGCEIGAIHKTFGTLKLERLSLRGSSISDLSGLADMTVLKSIDLGKNPELTSMEWLDSQNCTTLQTVDLSETGLEADDVAWLAKCFELTELSLNGLTLGDLSCISGLENLESLSAMNCGLTDISGLQGSTKLSKILLGFNGITSISPLSNLALENWVTLDLTNNKIETVAELPVGDYYAIMLYGNADEVAATLPEGIGPHEVVTPYFDEIRSTAIKDMTRNLYVVGCPQNQVVKMESAFGSRLNLISEDELWALYANDGFEYKLGDMSYLVSVAIGENETVVADGIEAQTADVPEVADAIPYSLDD